MKRILALLLTVIMLVSIMPSVGLAEGYDYELSRPLTLVSNGTSYASLTNCHKDYWNNPYYASWTILYATGTNSTVDVYNYIPYVFDTTITLNDGDWVSFKGINNAPNDNDDFNPKYLQFFMTGSIAAYGNIMSLCCSDNFAKSQEIPYDSSFYGLFKDCTSLTKAPHLPATTLAEKCYNSMFYGCTSLTVAPALPATTLESSSYSHMFENCSSLVTAPKLPATILAASCYNSMFSNCTSLTEAPALPATTLYDWCYYDMFHCCSSLIVAPELPATTLANDACYNYMFKGCDKLTIYESNEELTNEMLIFNLDDSKLAGQNVSKYALCMVVNSSHDNSKNNGNIPLLQRVDGNSLKAYAGDPASNTNYYCHKFVRIDEESEDYVKTRYVSTNPNVNIEITPENRPGYVLSGVYYTKGDLEERIEITNKVDGKYYLTLPDLDAYPNNYITISASYVLEDNTPRIAPAEKAVPKIYVGEDRPEITVLTLSDTYITENKTFSASAPIIIEDNRTFLGIRDMAYALGIDPMAIKWDEATKTASITKSGATIEVTQGSNIIKHTYGGYIYSVNSDVSAINKNDRIYLPFRVIFQLFGYTVNWDNDTRIITCK